MKRISSLIYHLTRAYWGYLSIKQAHKKDYDWFTPVVLTGLLFLAVWQSELGFTNLIDFAEKTSSFLAILPGFYIAALAAVATFNKPSIDKKIPDNPTPYVYQRSKGTDIRTELSRRRFLTMLFAFLAAESLMLFLLTVVAGMMKDPAIFVSIPFTLVFFFLFFQLITVTLWGLYYLSEKMHHND